MRRDATQTIWTGKETIAVACPSCGSRKLGLGELQFAGMPIFVECLCDRCGRRYWLDWPAGHALLHPTLIDADSGAVYFDGLDWYPRRVAECLASRGNPRAAAIDVDAAEPRSDHAIFVDCIDFLFGHCLLKLLSGISYARRNPNADVIVVAPSTLSWMVPRSCAVRITVDLPLSRSARWIAGIDEHVKQAAARYDRVTIAPAISQPAPSREDVGDLLDGKFAPQSFWSRSGTESNTVVTIVLREDRLWLGGRRSLGAAVADRFSASFARHLRVRRQNRSYAHVVRGVRRRLPNVEFAAVGIGTSGTIGEGVVDLRKTAITAEREHEWLSTYARSEVIVGVHGSNMLLPSALGGAVVDLIPPDKLRNLAQDLIIVDESEPKLALFRYRILPTSTTPAAVASIIVSLLSDRADHFANMIGNRTAYDVAGWPRAITWRRLNAG